MGTRVTYAFVNSETGSRIGFLTLAEDMNETRLLRKLNHEKARLAVKNAVYIEDIFWQTNQQRPLVK